jgi:DNA polymerase
VKDPREELSAIAREARTMLERERTRGRERIAFEPDSTNVWEVASRPPEIVQAVEAGDALTLPGFETRVPQPLPTFGPPPSALLAVRPELPDDLGTLARMVSECRKCGLCETRTNTVFADGSPRARLVFIGEAPGRDEDLKGLPFVGRAGQLLDKMIAAIDLKREDVYICNVLKCRPPENRVPAPQEVEQCLPYLEQQLALLSPALLCALGLSAVQALLKTKASMSSLRGRTFEYKGIPLIPTYHPAALLRNPGLKREAWEDMQRVRDTLKARTAS